MNAQLINPFLVAVESILSQFGVADIRKGAVMLKEEMVIERDVTAFVGVVGDLRGNIAYCFTAETARKLASAMMMGMPVPELDEMSRSAIAELANVITGNAASLLVEEQVKVDITPPSMIVGKDIYLVLSSVRTLIVTFETPVGSIEVHICLEV